MSTKISNLLFNGHCTVSLGDLSLLTRMRHVISTVFSASDDSYFDISRESFHMLIEEAQYLLNEKPFLAEVAHILSPTIYQQLDYRDISWVSVLKLRAVRPISIGINDAVPFHRETLYSDSIQTRFQHNVWIPLAIDALSALNYYPKSHTLLDSALVIEESLTHPVAVSQFSPGHRIGYPYKPKIISNTPELMTTASKLYVPLGQAAIFSAMLVHGNGINRSDTIRFSVDTGFIPTSEIRHNKELFAARLNQHYIRIGDP